MKRKDFWSCKKKFEKVIIGNYKLFQKSVMFHIIENLYNIEIWKMEIKDQNAYDNVWGI